MIKIQSYREGLEAKLYQIYFETVRKVNIRDYSLAQVEAWAPQQFDMSLWTARLNTINPYIAYWNDEVAGFADLQSNGYIDMFFCRADLQGKGVGRALMSRLIQEGNNRSLTTLHSNVSITAKPFFERFGFTALNSQEVHVRGQIFIELQNGAGSEG